MGKEDKKYFEEVLDRLKFIMATDKNGVVAARLGMTDTAFSNRLKKGTVPYEYIIPWSSREYISIDFILLGIGKPFLDVYNRIAPQPVEQSAAEPYNHLPQASYDSGMVNAQASSNPENIKIKELFERLRSIEPRTLESEDLEMVKCLVGMAERILSSNNIVLREALKSNIVAFSEALDSGVRHTDSEEKIALLEQELARFKEQIQTKSKNHEKQ